MALVAVRNSAPLLLCLLVITHFFTYSRSHKHQGCTKNFPSMKATFELKTSDEKKTDYQVSYGKKDVKSSIYSMRPAPRSLNPLPPVMDFRTTNRIDFKRLQHDDRTKPCKV